MPTCQHCHHKWSWTQTFKNSFTLDTGMTCPHCGVKQYPTTKTRKRSAICSFIPPFSLLLLMFNLPSIIVFSFLFGSAILLLCLYPFLVELSNQEEPLW